MRKANLFCYLTVCMSVLTALGAPGDFDLTFGYGGAAQSGTSYDFYFNGSASEEPVHCCVLEQQADGKLIVAGATDAASPRLILRRFNTNGTLDTSYGLGGEAIASGPYPAEFVYGVPLDVESLPNGKTVVSGFVESGDIKVFSVWRFTNAGVLDTAFGSDGKITRPNALDNSGKSVSVYRNTIYAAGSRSRIYCINENGSACVGFGGIAGYLSVVGVDGVAIQPGTNKLLASGSGWVKRYSLGGQIDTSFGQSGTASVCSPQCGYCPTRSVMAVNSNGKIVTATSSTASSVGFILFYTVAQLNANGQPDLAFGGNACIGDEAGTTPPFAYPRTQRGLDVQTDGRILLLEGPSIAYNASTNGNWTVARFNTDGSLDTTFVAAGTLDRNQDVLVQADGKIVTVGSTYSSSTDSLSNIFLGRYLP
jgi:uncharacterized delta-60 repeat protein